MEVPSTRPLIELKRNLISSVATDNDTGNMENVFCLK